MAFSSQRIGFIGQGFAGWQCSMVMKLAKGTPFTVTGSGLRDLNFDRFAERPAVIDPSVLGRQITNPNTSQELLPREAFRASTVSDYGVSILGRNTFFLDGVQNFDFGIYKTFRMPFERHRLTFRAELYNAFNHVQYGFPSSVDFTSPAFGRLSTLATQYNPRNVQFALRYQF